MADSIVLDIILTADDIYDFQIANFISNKKSRYSLLTVLFFSLLFIFRIFNSESGPPFEIFAAVFIVMVIFVVYAFPKMLKKNCEKQLESNKALQKGLKYIINSDGINCTGDFGNSTYKWQDLYTVRETKKCFLLYLANNQAYYLPKRCFAGEEEMNLARELFKQIPENDVTGSEYKGMRRLLMAGIFIFIFSVIFLMILTILTRN